MSAATQETIICPLPTELHVVAIVNVDEFHQIKSIGHMLECPIVVADLSNIQIDHGWDLNSSNDSLYSKNVNLDQINSIKSNQTLLKLFIIQKKMN